MHTILHIVLLRVEYCIESIDEHVTLHILNCKQPPVFRALGSGYVNYYAQVLSVMAYCHDFRTTSMVSCNLPPGMCRSPEHSLDRSARIQRSRWKSDPLPRRSRQQHPNPLGNLPRASLPRHVPQRAATRTRSRSCTGSIASRSCLVPRTARLAPRMVLSRRRCWVL